MQTAVVKYGAVSPEQLEMFLEMRSIFERLPDFPFNKPFNLSCHIVARAFAENYPVEVVDGYFTLGQTHSWLVLERCTMQEHGQDSFLVADIFPIGSGVPFLIHADISSPWFHMYLELPSVADDFRDHPVFLERVSIVAWEIDRLRKG